MISARLGFVALGAGEMATLDLSGDGFLSVAVPSSQLGNLVSANGALVSNKGKILANGGTVFLSAATASNILRNAINSGGLIRANSVGMHNGRIVLNGGGGNVNVSGRVLANGGKHHNGGTVTVLGDQIKINGIIAANGKNGGGVSVIGTGDVTLTGTLMANGIGGQGGLIALTGNNVSLVAATIDAWGATGGGAVDIGGGPHSTVALADAQSVSVDSVSSINADALKNGNGGHIVIWSAGQTTAQGTFTAKGGANGGNGGLIETSGQTLDFTGAVIDASAANGTAGTWLLDPSTITISTQAAANTIDATLNTGPGGTNVLEQTTSSPGTITLSAGITLSWTTAATLTLDSSAVNGTITLGGSITAANGGLTLNAGSGAITDTSSVSVGTFTLNFGALVAEL